MERTIVLPGEKIFFKDLSSVINSTDLETAYRETRFQPNIKNSISKDLHVFDTFSYLGNLKKTCEEISTNFLKTCYYPDFEELIVTTSWFNNTTKEQHHHRHIHPFSVLSGIIYLDDNPENLNLNIFRKIPDIPYVEKGGVERLGLDMILSMNQTIPTNNLKNHLVLFLSSTNHDVSKVINEKKARRSLAFNTFFKGTVGMRSNPLGSINYNIS
jgi:hypothetical protein